MGAGGSSARTAGKLSRILAMLPWVIAHQGASVDEVCERFGYTRAELLSDLDLVFVCGLPGYGPGDLMVAYVEGDQVVVDMADYFAEAPRLTPAEALALLSAGLAMVGSGQGSEALDRAVRKLNRVLVPEGEELLSVDLDAEPELVTELRRAAAEGRVVTVEYVSLGRKRRTVREVEPWTIFSSLGNWYLSGHDRLTGEERIFRVDRIKSLEVSTETFEVPSDLPEPDVRYTPSEEDVHCVLELGEGARWVVEYYPVEILGEDGEVLRVRFSSPDPSVPAGLLLRLGGEATLVEGEEVAQSLARLKEEVLARYEQS